MVSPEGKDRPHPSVASQGGRLAVVIVASIVALAACGGHLRHPARTTTGDDVTLYRDLALVRQHVDVQVPATATTIKLLVATGITSDQLMIVDRGGLTIGGVHVPNPDASKPAAEPAEEQDVAADDTGANADDTDVISTPPAKPTEVRIDVAAPHPGRYGITIAYVTDRLHWDAAYTMTTTPVRERAVLHGAIAIRNATGVALRNVAIHVVDADFGAWRTRTAEHLASTLIGGTQSSTPAAVPRDLGSATIEDGTETRVELTGIGDARRMRSVLVYDPIGTKLDHPGAEPLREPALGVQPPASARITESFEVVRDERASVGLPAGPVRLLERRPDGSLAVLGESRLFDAATRVAEVDTIAVGTAEGVVGHRERREFTSDDDRHRLVEEFVITLDNTRAHKVAVLIREHVYRGQNWVLAYESTKRATKEGVQQIAMRTDVPANAQAKILYVVVYTWSP